MQRVKWKLYEININTIITVVGFLIVLGVDIFWVGYKYADLVTAIQKNSDTIGHLQTDMASLQTSRTADENDISGLKYRVGTLETGAASTASTLHDQDKAISQIASDVRATRQLVECLVRKDCNLGGH